MLSHMVSYWFVDLALDDPSFDHSTFSRNRARLLEHEVASEFFRVVVQQARSLNRPAPASLRLKLLSEAHASTSVPSTVKCSSERAPPDDTGNPTVNFRGERRSNTTHQSTTDPEARLARKGAGKEARLCYSANALMENRNTILLDFQVEPADGEVNKLFALLWFHEASP